MKARKRGGEGIGRLGKGRVEGSVRERIGGEKREKKRRRKWKNDG